MLDFIIKLSAIFKARQRINSLVWRTPLIESYELSKRTDEQVYFKAECLQVTGSFKLRGAASKILSLTGEERSRGIIAVSSGNHGRAVSYIASHLGIEATICVSKHVPENKLAAIRRNGAQLVVEGQTYEEAEEIAVGIQRERGLVRIDPFDDPYVIAGQGTLGLEIIEDLPEVRTVLVPMSGGGLISGIAIALKSADPSIRLIGVTMEKGAAMVESLRAGHIVEITEEPTLADGLAGGIPPDNRYTFRLCQRYVDDAVLVSEAEIARAMRFALEEDHLVVEGSGAVGIAALLHDKVAKLKGPVVAVLSGGNVDLGVLLEIANQHGALGQRHVGS
ncbi:MAG TPA: hydroxyectoine utilization dehydratase EutB [Candidatus Acetothermia bacterium]|nr:hydroxyectoine utilization dehydratase EutB [Candidatus Acetothermia bacterium]